MCENIQKGVQWESQMLVQTQMLVEHPLKISKKAFVCFLVIKQYNFHYDMIFL